MYILYTTTPVSCVRTLLWNTTVQLCQWINSKNVKIGQLLDRCQQSFQQQFIMVVAAINLCTRVHKHQSRPEQPSFETATDTISDLLKVGRVRKRWLAATSQNHFECWLLGLLWNFFSSVKKMKSSASVGTDATTFFAHIRRDAVCRREVNSAVFYVPTNTV